MLVIEAILSCHMACSLSLALSLKFHDYVQRCVDLLSDNIFTMIL